MLAVTLTASGAMEILKNKTVTVHMLSQAIYMHHVHSHNHHICIF